jgi:ankyrin repeat protein
MRLLKIEIGGDFSLVECVGNDIPRYAVLSHTWGEDDEEYTFEDWNNDTGKTKAGYYKIRSCGQRALNDGFNHFWVDTCCIDKSSSAELSEAINSMYLWYQAAEKCYAYLGDVPSKKSFSNSRWFTRGWTLQELIAPAVVEFFNEKWDWLGTKVDLQQVVSECTEIPISILSGAENLEAFSVAQKMSWAARRTTIRVEDRAYSMMGIFEINMPLIYGEGENAFIRLQEEILKISEDHSIFAWRSTDDRGGCLANSPESFANSCNIIQSGLSDTPNEPTIVSSRGIHMDIPFVGSRYKLHGFAILNCHERGREEEVIAICVRDLSLTMKRFERVCSGEFAKLDFGLSQASQYPIRRVCIQKGRITRARKAKIPRNPDDNTSQDDDPGSFLRDLFNDGHSNTLLEAVKMGLEEEVWFFLTKGTTWVNARGKDNKTALCHAAIIGNERVVKMLLSQNSIDIDPKDGLARTPLSWAAECGYDAVVKLLLNTGMTNVNSQDSARRTPLSRAAENGHEAVVKLLLSIHETKVDGNNQYPTDEQTPLTRASAKGHDAVVKLLLNTGMTNVNSQDSAGRTPLSRAAENGHEAVVKLLLNTSGVYANTRDRQNHSPLSRAVRNGHAAVVELLSRASEHGMDAASQPRLR